MEVESHTGMEKQIRAERIYELAENAIKVTPRTNSSKLFNKLNKLHREPGICLLSSKIKSALYDSLIETQIYNPVTAEETKTHCVSKLIQSIEDVTGLPYTEKRQSKGASSKSDYTFESVNHGVTTRLTVIAKSFENSIFTVKNKMNVAKANQSSGVATSNSNGHGYSLTLLTNGREIAVFMQGVVECDINIGSGFKGKWQPLRDISKPILTLSCYDITDEDCNVLALLIYNTLVGRYETILKVVKDVYTSEVTTLMHEVLTRDTQITI